MQVVSNGKLREITRDGYNEVNKSFKKKTGTEFNEALNEVKEPKITKKKKKKKKNTKLQRKQELRQKYRQQIKTHEEQLRSTDC